MANIDNMTEYAKSVLYVGIKPSSADKPLGGDDDKVKIRRRIEWAEELKRLKLDKLENYDV